MLKFKNMIVDVFKLNMSFVFITLLVKHQPLKQGVVDAGDTKFNLIIFVFTHTYTR